MSREAKKHEIFLARPQRAALRFPRGWDDVCGAELLELLDDPLTPQSKSERSAPRIVPLRSGFELRGVSFRSLCELPLRSRTLRELVWLVDSGSAVSKEALADTITAGPLHWILGSTASVIVKASSQRSRLFHTGLIQSEIEAALQRQGVRIAADDTAGVTVYAELWRDTVAVGIGLGGESLGKRGYKVDLRSPASIKEELAACCIDGFRRWIRQEGGEFEPDVAYVPFAGSGTLAAEAVLSWGVIAPAIFKRSYAMESIAAAPMKSIQHARKRIAAKREAKLPRVVCIERDHAQANALRLNMAHLSATVGGVDIEVVEADWFDLPNAAQAGAKLFVPLNPPYGERLEGDESARDTYRRIGAQIRRYRRAEIDVAGLLLCPDAATRRAFIEGCAGGRHTTRAISHGGKKMEVLYFRTR